MPEVRYYTVTQTREVKVAVNSLLEAAALATRAFDQEAVTSQPGSRVLTQIRETALDVTEDS